MHNIRVRVCLSSLCGDRLRLHHSNHRIDVRGLEPEFLAAVAVLGEALLERLGRNRQALKMRPGPRGSAFT
jgi:hypothetical protein